MSSKRFVTLRPATGATTTPAAATMAGLLLIATAATTTTGTATAQDKITWVDGTVTTDAKVTGFNLREVKFNAKGSPQSKPADQVYRLNVKQVEDTYKRAIAATPADSPGMFATQARSLIKKEPFLAQFGFVEAARQMMSDNQPKEAFGLLEEMAKELPDSGFLPELYRTKLDYYLSLGKEGAQNAAKVAKDYITAVNTQGFPEGALHEAEFYQVMVDAVSGQLNPAEMERRLNGVLAKTEGTFPNVANRARLALADALRAQKKTEQAQRYYTDLLDKGTLSKSLLAQAWMGLGYINLEQGDASNKEPFKQAFLNFLHVYLDTPEAPDEVVAEALFNGKVAAEKWGGLDSGMMSKRLEIILKRNPRFAETAWAKR